MKLLLDANLSWRLAEKLKAHFTDCLHVDKTGLTVPAKDAGIWTYALQHNFVLVTNDDDFLDLARVKGSRRNWCCCAPAIKATMLSYRY